MQHTNYKRYTFILFLVIKKNNSAVKSQSLNFIFSSCFPILHPLQYLSLKKIEAKQERERERKRQFWKSIFQYSRAKIQPRKQWNQLYISVWIGRLDREGGGQSGPWAFNESGPAGVIGWSGPSGELALPISFPLFGVVGLTTSLGD